ncbi:MAG: stage V sporulation protein K, partial [Thermacetogeniaceae bacterium]
MNFRLNTQPFRNTSHTKESYQKPLTHNKHNKRDDVEQLKPETIMQELNSLIGLTEVKNLVAEIYAFIQIQKRREKEKLCTDPLVLHMIFKGNPGTGKT